MAHGDQGQMIATLGGGRTRLIGTDVWCAQRVIAIHVSAWMAVRFAACRLARTRIASAISAWWEPQRAARTVLCAYVRRRRCRQIANILAFAFPATVHDAQKPEWAQTCEHWLPVRINLHGVVQTKYEEWEFGTLEVNDAVLRWWYHWKLYHNARFSIERIGTILSADTGCYPTTGKWWGSEADPRVRFVHPMTGDHLGWPEWRDAQRAHFATAPQLLDTRSLPAFVQNDIRDALTAEACDSVIDGAACERDVQLLDDATETRARRWGCPVLVDVHGEEMWWEYCGTSDLDPKDAMHLIEEVLSSSWC